MDRAPEAYVKWTVARGEVVKALRALPSLPPEVAALLQAEAIAREEFRQEMDRIGWTGETVSVRV